MTGIHLQPPGPFNFHNPDDWQRWKCRFQQFGEASCLDECAELKQISTLLYWLGEELEAVLALTNTTDEERQECQKVLDKFDSFKSGETSYMNVPDSTEGANKVAKMQSNTSWPSTISQKIVITAT